jgi:hypothetical protein
MMKTALKVVLLILFDLSVFTVAASAQTKLPFYATGERYLQVCDSTYVGWEGAKWSKQESENMSTMCLAWLVGLRQGFEVLQQLRPLARQREITPEEIRLNKENAEMLRKQFGIDPDFETTLVDICIPDDVTNSRTQLVFVKWLHDHPKQLSVHASYLLYTALTEAYACKVPR